MEQFLYSELFKNFAYAERIKQNEDASIQKQAAIKLKEDNLKAISQFEALEGLINQKMELREKFAKLQNYFNDHPKEAKKHYPQDFMETVKLLQIFDREETK